MNHPLVRAVVVNWNGKDYLLRCLQSMRKLHYPPEQLQILVVDFKRQCIHFCRECSYAFAGGDCWNETVKEAFFFDLDAIAV